MLGILCTIAQAAAATWGAVFGTDVLGLAAGLAALGFVLYTAAMTVSRLLNDRWVEGLGLTRFVRTGAVISLLSLLAVIASAPLQAPVLAFAGFAGVGVGSSSMFPAMVVTAGSLPGIASGYGVALVSWMVRIGIMVAPPLIGAAADALGLATALWIPAAAAVAILLLAPVMTGVGRTAARREPA
jgi:MFS family permease